MINYFRDRMDDELRFSLQLDLKVEVDLLRCLTRRDEIKTNALTFYRDALTLYPNRVRLFTESVLYLHFAAMLRDSLESLENKAIVLDIITILSSR